MVRRLQDGPCSLCMCRRFPDRGYNVDVTPAPVGFIFLWMREFRVPEDLQMFLGYNQMQRDDRGDGAQGYQTVSSSHTWGFGLRRLWLCTCVS